MNEVGKVRHEMLLVRRHVRLLEEHLDKLDVALALLAEPDPTECEYDETKDTAPNYSGLAE